MFQKNSNEIPSKYLCFFFLAASHCITSQELPPAQSIFMQGNNINAVFRTDGYFNYDKVTFSSGEAGFIWPASSTSRKTAVFTSGIWIGAKAGPQRELSLLQVFITLIIHPAIFPL